MPEIAWKICGLTDAVFVRKSKEIYINEAFRFAMKQFCCAILFGLCFTFCALVGQASVNGPCANCHTMHNSQNGGTVATILQSGVRVAAPVQKTLLVSDCVGCHSSSTGDTIVTLTGGTRIPIVYNTGGYPAKPLAGGNFYHVAQGGATNDVYGHNVYGISGMDNNLSAGAPGGEEYNCTNSCHHTLANNLSHSYGTNGCTACHSGFKHHGSDPPPGSPETAASGWYRFLAGHKNLVSIRYVEGIEDPDWEQAPTATAHNGYTGVKTYYNNFTTGQGLSTNHTTTAFCGGCHKDFHADNGGYPDNVGPWVRHPTDLALPATGEYANYNPTTAYDPQVPVGWINPSSPTRETAVVMCLSCHRAHGSEYPDMLRWDYTKMITGDGVTVGNGCFKCHSAKDN